MAIEDDEDPEIEMEKQVQDINDRSEDALDPIRRFTEESKKMSKLFIKYGRFEDLSDEKKKAFIKESIGLDVSEKTFEEGYKENISSDYEKEKSLSKEFEDEADFYLDELENFNFKNSEDISIENSQNIEREL